MTIVIGTTGKILSSFKYSLKFIFLKVFYDHVEVWDIASILNNY